MDGASHPASYQVKETTPLDYQNNLIEPAA